MAVKSRQVREFYFECDQCGDELSTPHRDISVAAALARAQGFTIPEFDPNGNWNWAASPNVCRKCSRDDVTTLRGTSGLKHDLGLSQDKFVVWGEFWRIAGKTIVGKITPRTIKSVLGLRYGEFGDRVQTVEKVAELLGVTQQRATQIITQCLKEMRSVASQYVRNLEEKKE